MNKFLSIPIDPNKLRRWVSFVSRQNAEILPWMPEEGDRVCSEHFIPKKISNLPGNPDYMPSTYLDITVKQKCSSGTCNSNFNTNAVSVFHFE